MFNRILVPVDGSPTSTKALVTALQLARESGGRVRLVHSFDELTYLTGYEYSVDLMQQCRGHAEKVLQQALEIARAAGIEADAKLLEVPGQRLGDAVAEEARRFDAELIVVGTHGRRGLGRVLLGSGAEQVIRLAPVPVLTIRGEEEQKAG
jgi:nucleotide-binding universal stress UspA family protein